MNRLELLQGKFLKNSVLLAIELGVFGGSKRLAALALSETMLGHLSFQRLQALSPLAWRRVDHIGVLVVIQVVDVIKVFHHVRGVAL